MRLVAILILAALGVGIVGAFTSPASGNGVQLLAIVLLALAVLRWLLVTRREAGR